MRLNRKPADNPDLPDPAADTDNPGLASRLLREVFDGYEPGDRLAVLDLGTGNARTVQFLSQFHARISFVGLLDHLDELQDPELDPTQLESTLRRLLNLKPDARYDVILLWDVVHYLPAAMLATLSSLLEPHTAKHTRGYGFGSLQADRVHEPGCYGIASPSHITVMPSSAPAFSAHSQQQMNQKFLCMHIAKATLLQEGKLELLFERH